MSEPSSRPRPRGLRLVRPRVLVVAALLAAALLVYYVIALQRLRSVASEPRLPARKAARLAARPAPPPRPPMQVYERTDLGGPDGNATCLAASADGQLAACANRLGALYLWDLPTNQNLRCVQQRSSEFISQLSFSADHTRLALFYFNGGISVWDTAGGGMVAMLTGLARGGVFLDENRKLLVAAPEGFVYWDIDSEKPIRTIAVDAQVRSEPSPPAVSPDGRYMAASFEPGAVTIMPLAQPEQHVTLSLPGGPRGASLPFAADGKLYTVRVSGVVWMPDGASLIVSDGGSLVRVGLDGQTTWHVPTGKIYFSRPVLVSGGGQVLVTTHNAALCLRSTADGHDLNGPGASASALAASADGRFVITSISRPTGGGMKVGQPNAAIVWDAAALGQAGVRRLAATTATAPASVQAPAP